MTQFLVFGVGGPTSFSYGSSREGAVNLDITSSFDVATVGHLFITSEFNVVPTTLNIPITSEFTVAPTGEDLAITSSFTTGVV